MKIGADTPALVTGGASGLGAATARQLRAVGAPVALLDLDLAGAEALASEIGATAVQTDVTSDASVDAALATAEASQGAARILVACAGIAPAAKVAGAAGAHPMALFERVIAVNLTGTLRVLAGVADRMRALSAIGSDAERGVAVLTASVAAYEGQIGQAAYAASKGGVAALVLPAARDLARDGIRVAAIAPGLFATPMLAGLPDEVRASLGGQVPFPARLGEPSEFARLAQVIVETPYLNGCVLRLDGAIRMAPR